MNKRHFIYLRTIFLLSFVFLFPISASASTSLGTIDPTYHYAWGENIGFIDFGSTAGAVTIADSALTGYAYGENIGWISLNCSNTSSCGTVSYSVTNNSEGTLGGYGWSENTGWIDFSHVTIGTNGVFAGYAYGENIGFIIFDTANAKVVTDWRPLSSRTSSSATPTPTPGSYTGGSTSGGSSYGPISTQTPVAGPLAYSNCGPGDAFNSTTGQPCSTGSAAATVPTTGAAITQGVFSRNLSVGAGGLDVKALQIFLNSHGFPVAFSGPGSLGNETSYFGVLTRAALSKFQIAKGIKPSIGYFGPITKAFVSNMIKSEININI